ncbi:hypothetical protein, partial [Alteromonas sp. P256]|uniref:hypothetical protein n=1 Tax=Alteromonas sp. P256 TaxID=3117399 RepID=UPI002FE37F24
TGTLFLATDFESVMSTNFITLASHCNGYAPMRCIIAMQRAHTTLFFVNYLQVLKVYTLGAVTSHSNERPSMWSYE